MLPIAHTDDAGAFYVARGIAQQESVIEQLASACGLRPKEAETSADIEIAQGPKPYVWSTAVDEPSPPAWFSVQENVIELMHESPCGRSEVSTSVNDGPSPAAWCADRDIHDELALRVWFHGAAQGGLFSCLFSGGVAVVVWMAAKLVTWMAAKLGGRRFALAVVLLCFALVCNIEQIMGIICALTLLALVAWWPGTSLTETIAAVGGQSAVARGGVTGRHGDRLPITA